MSLVQGGLIRWFIPKYGQAKSIIYGIILYAVGLFCFAFATQGWMMYAFLIPYCLGGLCGPALQGVISNQIPENEQGEIQGLNTSLMSVSAIISPLVMTNLFYQFSKSTATIFFPGISFFISAILAIIAAIIIVYSLKKIAID